MLRWSAIVPLDGGSGYAEPHGVFSVCAARRCLLIADGPRRPGALPSAARLAGLDGDRLRTATALTSKRFAGARGLSARQMPRARTALAVCPSQAQHTRAALSATAPAARTTRPSE